jgi:hypothetical protein
MEGNLRARHALQANTAQDPHVLPVLLVDIKQLPLVQHPVPHVYLVPQDLPIRPVLVPLLQIGYVRHVVHVLLEHGEVLLVLQPQTLDVPPV